MNPLRRYGMPLQHLSLPTFKTIQQNSSFSQWIATKTHQIFKTQYTLQSKLAIPLNPHSLFKNFFRIYPSSTPTSYCQPFSSPKQVHFDQSNVVFYQDLVIGKCSTSKDCIHLVAYEKKGLRMKWAIKWEEESMMDFYLSPQGIFITQKNISSAILLNPRTGKPSECLELPVAPQSPSDQLHLAPNGFCYYASTTKEILFGGRFIQGKWTPVFEKKIPSGNFSHLGNFVCFSELFPMHQTVIFNEQGEEYIFQNCMEILSHRETIYAVCQAGETTSYLIAMPQYELRAASKLSDCKMRLTIPHPAIKIFSACDDGTLICFEKESFKIFFANIENEKIAYISHKFTAQHDILVDPKKKMIWSWDQFSQDVYRHTAEESRRVGKLTSGSNSCLIYSDDQDVLYYIDPTYT